MNNLVDFVDLQYAMVLSSRLDKFKVRSTNPYKINFRCPICGDSQKSKSKSRGWLLEKENTFHYFCHNCGVSQSFKFFLKNVDNLAYNDYITEKYVSNVKVDKKEAPLDSIKSSGPKFKPTNNPLKLIKKISQLQPNHPVKEYIERRGIPSAQHYRLYYAPKFKTWINSIIPNKFDIKGKDEPRLIMPFFDREGKMFGLSARSFDPNGMRYITIMFDERPKIFGLDKVDFNKQYFIVEGAIDSMFLSNAIAMAGADANTSSLEHIENAIFVHDAEPRNAEICKRMEKLLRAGNKVCIWPSTVPAKDINDMYLLGMHDVEKVIVDNAFSGLTGQLRLQTWKKCG